MIVMIVPHLVTVMQHMTVLTTFATTEMKDTAMMTMVMTANKCMVHLSSTIHVHLPNVLSNSIHVHLPSVITSQSDSGHLHFFVFLPESLLGQNVYALCVVVFADAFVGVPRYRLATLAIHCQWLA